MRPFIVSFQWRGHFNFHAFHPEGIFIFQAFRSPHEPESFFYAQENV